MTGSVEGANTLNVDKKNAPTFRAEHDNREGQRYTKFPNGNEVQAFKSESGRDGVG